MGKTIVFILLATVLGGCYSSKEIQVPHHVMSDAADASVESLFCGSLRWDLVKNAEKQTRYESKEQIQKEDRKTFLTGSFYVGDGEYLLTVTPLPLSGTSSSGLGIYRHADGHYYLIASAMTPFPPSEISMKMDYSLKRFLVVDKVRGTFGYLPFESLK